jgi:hypothetical protein
LKRLIKVTALLLLLNVALYATWLLNGSLQVNGNVTATGKGVFPDSLRAGPATFTGDCSASFGKWTVRDSLRVNGSIISAKFNTLPDNATPSAVGANNWKCTPASPTTITNFGGTSGQIINIVFTNGNATLSGSNLKLNSAFTSTANDGLSLIYDGTNWYELGRSSTGSPPAGGTNYVWLPGRLWADNAVTEVGTANNEYPAITNFINGSNIDNYASFVVPADYTATTTWKIYFSTNGTDAGTVDWLFGIGKLVAGSTMVFAFTATTTSIAGSGTTDGLVIGTLTTPSGTMLPGEIWKLRVRRPSTDTNADDARFVGILLTYH